MLLADAGCMIRKGLVCCVLFVLAGCSGGDAAEADLSTDEGAQSVGACTVTGAIRAEYDALGGPASVLGRCITNELSTPDGVGRYNHFEGGSIYWTPTTGAHELHGSIRQKWASLGWERSPLGYPTQDEMEVAGGRQSNFQYGAIAWRAATNETSVRASGDPSACEIPAGADARIHVALARPGARCTRYPFPLAAPRGVVETRDGSIFVTEWAGGRIVRLTPSGFTTVATGLRNPIGIVEDASGALLVTEEGAHSLSRIDRNNGNRVELTNALDNATYVTLGSDNAAYVSSFTAMAPTGRVVRVGLGAPSAPTTYASGLDVPEGLFFGADGRLVVAEWHHAPARVVRFQAGGGSVAQADTATTDLEHVYGVLGGDRGGLYVADTADRVMHVEANGDREVVLSNVAVPAGLGRTASGDLLVIELADLGFGKMGYLLRVSGL